MQFCLSWDSIKHILPTYNLFCCPTWSRKLIHNPIYC